VPTCVTCAKAGTVAANTMASIAANNITFFKNLPPIRDQPLQVAFFHL
jgi:hypothetical protein